ncbi:low affinity immunoglobulin gamma Fc region receptor II-like [Thalassophryne amazonica]|uniref:low affinity immunoglobulin gamma Fc region receptor II-like n=1 Tax=Thalassophryne amazonica TaxID=390379 RepID=UPI0014711B56|nr:low affinity immunoglobulin gamma Fc region receptor II-like [Thalassophryne amazonica]
MEITALCTVMASIRVVPNRSQFFMYESFSLSCGERGNWPEWTLKRNTTQHINKECLAKTKALNCTIIVSYPSDSGVYWCESKAGECRDAVNITVSREGAILESPALPVMEGHDVTLRCKYNRTFSPPADFYKDGRFIGNSSTGNLSIPKVSKSDEGLYSCHVSAGGQSPGSWLAVREARLPHVPLSYVLLPVAGVCIFMATMVLLCLWKSHKGESDPADVSYTDVIIPQDVKLKPDRGLESRGTFYSTLNLAGAT